MSLFLLPQEPDEGNPHGASAANISSSQFTMSDVKKAMKLMDEQVLKRKLNDSGAHFAAMQLTCRTCKKAMRYCEERGEFWFCVHIYEDIKRQFPVRYKAGIESAHSMFGMGFVVVEPEMLIDL